MSCIARISGARTIRRREPDQQETSPTTIGYSTPTGAVSQPSYSNTQPAVSRKKSRVSYYKSSWLSPLEKSNVPADVKLRYINESEQQRFAKIMTSTKRLLENGGIDHSKDAYTRRLMSYRPNLAGPESKTGPTVRVEVNESEDELDGVALRADRGRLNQLVQGLAAHVEEKRARLTDDTSKNLSDRIRQTPVNPVLLGSQTSRALINSFYACASAGSS